MKIHLSAIILLIIFSTIASEREHKVHNIVLYPERHSWCQVTPIQQVVASPGYKPVTIDNNVCVGACFSYSIPRTQPSEPGEEIGPYCDSCQPLESNCYHVTLEPESDNLDGPRTFQKRLQIIQTCSCSHCGRIHEEDCDLTEGKTEELPSRYFVNENSINQTEDIIGVTNPTNEDFPELLNEDLSKRNESHFRVSFDREVSDEPKYELTTTLLLLLKNIQEKNDVSLEKHEVKELISLIRGNEKKLNDKNLMEFVNFFNVNNSEDFELDLGQLKKILHDFQKSQGDESEIGTGFHLDINEKNGKIENDLKKLNTKYEFGSDFGIEGSRLSLPPHLRGSHIAMGIKPITPEINNEIAEADDDDDEDGDDLTNTAYHVDTGPLKFTLKADDGSELEIKTTQIPYPLNYHIDHSTRPNDHPIHHKHHLGEEQQIGLDVGHLTKGPHGSMIFTPDFLKVEEKLDLDTDHLKPNHEGLVIAYENHHKPADVVGSGETN